MGTSPPQGGGRAEVRSSPRRVTAAVAALSAAALACWLLAPIMDLTFSTGPRATLRWAPDAWLPPYDRLYEGLGRDRGLPAYFFWGRFTVLVYAAGLFGALTFPRGPDRSVRIGRRLLVLGFVLGLVGDVGAYWGAGGTSSGPQPLPMAQQPLPDLENAVTGVFFLGESLAGLLILLGLGLMGAALLRERRRPIWVPWALLAGALGTLPVAIFVIDYVPHGFLLPVMVTMAVALAGLARGHADRS
jgi:hypothetical protein